MTQAPIHDELNADFHAGGCHNQCSYSPSKEAQEALAISKENKIKSDQIKDDCLEMRREINRVKDNAYNARNAIIRHEAECTLKSQLMIDKIEAIKTKVDVLSASIGGWLRVFVFMLLASWAGLALLVMKLLAEGKQ